MPNFSSIAAPLHVLAAVLWVGGMFFAYVILRNSLGGLEGPQRLRLWNEVFSRFFPWVWAAVILLPATGYGQVFLDFGSFSDAGLHVHIMHGLGLLMIVLFFYLFFAPYQKFQKAVAAEDWAAAAGHLNQIRLIVGTNLALGLITVALGASGRFWV